MRCFLFATLCFVAAANAADMTLEGLPLQVEWADLNGDGKLDLTALMLVSQTEGEVETFFEGGMLRGVYADQTFREKYVIAWLQTADGWRAGPRLDLGRAPAMGFAIAPGAPPALMLWADGALTRCEWTAEGWKRGRRIEAPGLLAGESASLSGFPFWQALAAGARWIVPDVAGVHVLDPERPEAGRFIDYPALALTPPATAEDFFARETSVVAMAMPRFLDVNGDGDADLLFQGSDQAAAWSLREARDFYGGASGHLIDLDNDGLADLVETELEDEIERRSDLPKVTTRIRAYRALGPLRFADKPHVDQEVAGFVLQTEMDEIELPDPFLDLNGDGRPDLAGLAFRVSFFQLVKAATTGRINFRFLLHLHVQEKDGRYRPLQGNPFKMTWKINLRRLRMPALAQMTADFDGDGWIDLMMEKGHKLEITPLGEGGIAMDRQWTLRIPKTMRDPDQVYGQDVDGDGAAEFVVMKTRGAHTAFAVLRRDP